MVKAARHLQFGETIWLNPSKRLLGFHKWFFTRFEDMPKKVFEEFKRHKHTHPSIRLETSLIGHEHHSHTHPSVTVTSSLTSHTHTPYTGDTNCGKLGATLHGHTVTCAAADSHSHDATLSFGAANLGSPWYNHTHPITLTSITSGGTAHTHTVNSPTNAEGCDLEADGTFPCADNPHSHALTLTTASGGAAHTHTLGVVATGNAYSTETPINHRHAFSVNLDFGNSHSHSWASGSITAATCWGGISHTHANPADSGLMYHGHSLSGNTGYGGEAVVKKPIMKMDKGPHPRSRLMFSKSLKKFFG